MAVQRLAALEVPKSLRRPHAVIAACVVGHASRVADSKRDKSSWAFPHSQGSTETKIDGISQKGRGYSHKGGLIFPSSLARGNLSDE